MAGVNKPEITSTAPVQLREESYGPFTGRTQNFMRYLVGATATDARIKRSS